MADNQNLVSQLSSEKTEFKREITLFGGVSILGGIMIGGGIFYLGSYVLQRAGFSLGLSLLCCSRAASSRCWAACVSPSSAR